MESPTTNFTLTSKTSWQAAFWNSKCKKTHTVLLQKIILPASGLCSHHLLSASLPVPGLMTCFLLHCLLPFCGALFIAMQASLPVPGSQVYPQKNSLEDGWPKIQSLSSKTALFEDE